MKSFKTFINEVKKPTGDLKNACWKGYTAVGMKDKGGRKVPNCVPEETQVDESLGDAMLKIAHAKGHTSARIVTPAQKKKETQDMLKARGPSKSSNYAGSVDKYPLGGSDPISHRSYSEEFEVCKQCGQDPCQCDDSFGFVEESAAWQRKEGKSESGGLNKKGIASYRRENPGSKLSMAVTTKPSKLDPDSKAAKRRKSFCARMSGMKKRLTSAKTANDPDSRINKSLRKWNC